MRLLGDDLVCARGARVIIDGLSFEVGAGSGLKLTGMNGSGKTTLLRAIAGFLALRSGSVRLEGGDDERDLGEQCHFIGHANGIKASFTVRENLTFWQSFLAGYVQSAEIDEVLARFDLDDLAEIPAGYLSAGQKRRLGLARLLVAKRPVWLLDEPTVSLDHRSAKLVGAIVDAHISGGGIAVAATHLPLAIKLDQELRLGAATGPGPDMAEGMEG